MDGVQLPQGQSHFEEAVYFLPLIFIRIIIRIQGIFIRQSKQFIQQPRPLLRQWLNHFKNQKWTAVIKIKKLQRLLKEFELGLIIQNNFNITKKFNATINWMKHIGPTKNQMTATNISIPSLSILLISKNKSQPHLNSAYRNSSNEAIFNESTIF